jgi:hypothetical protein
MVVNTDPSDKPGAHWVAIYINADGVVDYFDSYGQAPQVPAIAEWIERQSPPDVNVNSQTLQSLVSAACGQHCIHFLIVRCKGHPMHSIVAMLSDSPFINDAYVTAYVTKHCNVKCEVFDENVLVEQLCNVFGV